MKRYLGVALGTLTVVWLLSAAQNDKPQNAAGGRTLEVMSHYKGAGAVDESHKIYIVLWDTADFVQPGSNTMPIDIKPVSSKNGSVTFTNIKGSPVYVSAVYDPKGAWDAQSAPPSGSSLGLYSDSKEPGKPAPIDVKSGEPATIHLSFDDSYKMP